VVDRCRLGPSLTSWTTDADPLPAALWVAAGMPSNGSAVLLAMPLIVVPLARWYLGREPVRVDPPVLSEATARVQ
jgi:hypothetical protein